MAARTDEPGSGLRSNKWATVSALLSITAYGCNWTIVEYLYHRNAWHPGSDLHHLLASVQAFVSLVALVLGIIGISKDRSRRYAFAAIVLAVLCLGGATV